MKHPLLTIIAAVVLVGCGTSRAGAHSPLALAHRLPYFPMSYEHTPLPFSSSAPVQRGFKALPPKANS